MARGPSNSDDSSAQSLSYTGHDAMNDWRAHLTAMLTPNTRAGTGTNTDHSAPGLYHTFALQGIAIFMIYIIFRCRGTWSSRKPSSSPKGHEVTASKDVSASDANKHRNPGTWTPEKFDYPEITPCTDALVDIKPILYRPFRWGEYHVTMGIRSMRWSEWIELDSGFEHYQRVRQFRLRTRGREAVCVLPPREDDGVGIAGGADAAKELVYELVEYLSRRYPSSFRITRLRAPPVPSVCGVSLGWAGEMPVWTVEVVETGVTYDLSELERLDGTDMGEAAMQIVTGLVQEDMAIMIEGTDGRYYFQAGSICTAGFWRLRDKIGRPLHEIHLSGNVAQYKEKLQTSMERYFKRMAVGTPVVRNNYFIQVVKPPCEDGRADDQRRSNMTEDEVDPEELAWSESTNGPEDDFQHGHGHSADPAAYLAPSTLRVRSERQTLRRLPRTGAIVFGIRTYLYKVEDLVRERGVAGRLASAIRSWPEDVATYKGREMYRDVLVGFLDECAEGEGEGEGTVADTLDYPY